MNRKLIFAAGIILFVMGASVAYVLSQKNTKTESSKTAPENVGMQEGQKPDSSGNAKGSYVDFTEDGFGSVAGVKLLFFHASWCPQCRALDESIRASELPNGVTIFKVDYDSSQSLRAKYGVTLQTTIVKTDNEGNKISSYVAYDEPTFQSVKRALLP